MSLHILTLTQDADHVLVRQVERVPQVQHPRDQARGRGRVAIYKDERFSDHAPLTIDYDWQL